MQRNKMLILLNGERKKTKYPLSGELTKLTYSTGRLSPESKQKASALTAAPNPLPNRSVTDMNFIPSSGCCSNRAFEISGPQVFA